MTSPFERPAAAEARARASQPAAEAQARAKRPRTPLAGPYGHPVHPILVTIPIGTWLASVVFDIIGFFVDDPRPFVLGAMVLVAIGLVGAVLAAVFGLLDLSQLAPGTRARRTGLIHMTINLSAIIVLLVGLIVRMNADPDQVSVLGFVLSVIAVAGLGVSGWLGGMLAYHYGVRVADEATQAEGFR